MRNSFALDFYQITSSIYRDSSEAHYNIALSDVCNSSQVSISISITKFIDLFMSCTGFVNRFSIDWNLLHYVVYC